MLASTDTYRDFRIAIRHDSDCENPVDPKNGGAFITYNAKARYTLGNTPVDPDEHHKLGERVARGELIGLPVYAYVHSGIALRTRSFKDIDPQEWDSGKSGYIYLPGDKLRAEYGVKRLTPRIKANIRQRFKSELDEFARWVNGECYSFEIFDETGGSVDSMSGLIGIDYAMGSAKEAVDAYIDRRGAGDEDEDDINNPAARRQTELC